MGDEAGPAGKATGEPASSRDVGTVLGLAIAMPTGPIFQEFPALYQEMTVQPPN